MTTDNNKDQLSSNIKMLQDILKEQIEFAKKGELVKMESLEGQANCLIEQITQDSNIEADSKMKLKKLFDELCLNITAQKDDVSGKLRSANKGKKIIQTYRNSQT